MTKTIEGATPHRSLSETERRALEEAAARRKAYEAKAEGMAAEIGGPKGEEPTRYGDWEKDGTTSDFS